MYLDPGCVISHQLQHVNWKSSVMIIFLHLLNLNDTKCPKENKWWQYIRGIRAKWLAVLVWLSTFWQQSCTVSETGWLPSLPQFCCNEGAVLLKQTGTLERYLNCLLNPGSLSYLHTNGPAAHYSAIHQVNRRATCGYACIILEKSKHCDGGKHQGSNTWFVDMFTYYSFIHFFFFFTNCWLMQI